ncbi:MAG: MarR family transcriptional regulator [Gemmatimonadetes bacterium]|nr:winged helix-turn-helix transcriptional regulator [Gemmatimonadota bacterium]NIU72096.1 MarR family transcriptional regulator [Gammaproteobacteria bacterium]NIX42659.1 MarR family transcriptional regulator [Gemmatimonadota bacterium]
MHFDLRDTIPFLLVRAYRALRHNLTEARWEAGLYEGRDLVVAEIARRGGAATASELCDTLDVRPAAMSALLRRARLAGYVERRRSPADGRAWLLSVTPVAYHSAARTGTVWRGIDRGLTDCIGAADRAELRRMLPALASALAAMDGSA